MALTHLGIYKISKSQTIAEVYTDRTSNKRSTVPLSENARWVNLSSALSELQTTKRLICSKTNAGNSLKADNPAKTKAELSKISRLQYIV